MREQPWSAFGTIAERQDDNHYGVILQWGQRVEATYYRTGVMTSFGAGDHVFLERIPGSSLWMITSHAFGNPGDTGSIGWFAVDHATFGLVDGSGRIVP